MQPWARCCGTSPRLSRAGRPRWPLGFCAEVVYADKSLFTACGPVWHQRDRVRGQVQVGLRHVDKTAAWSDSGYHEWVYGYGLHLTCTRAGFPVRFEVLPATVNERKALDAQGPVS